MGKLNFSDVTFWLQEVESSLKRQEEELIRRNNYPFLIKYYEGDMLPNEDELSRNKKRMAVINEYFPNVNALLAEVMYKNPEVVVEPMKPEAEQGVDVMKAALQYAMRELDALTEMRLGLFDMVFAGYCAIEVNHINVTKMLPELAFGSQQTMPDMGLIDKAKSLFKKSDSIEKAEENQAELQPEPEEAYATNDETYLRRWSPLDVILDYRAERVKDMRYVGKIIRMTHKEFGQRYPKFKDKVQPGDAEVRYSQQGSKEDKSMVTLYELQIKRQGDKYVNIVLSPNYKTSEIDYFERPYTTDGFNLKIGQLHEYGKLYPVSMAQINKAIQDDINNYITFEMEVAERNIPKRIVDKNRVKADGLARLNSRFVNDVVEVDGNPSAVVAQAPHTNISTENRELLAMFNAQKDKLWSISTARMSGASDAKFATELEIQEAGFVARQLDIQTGLQKLYHEVLDTLKDIIVQFWDNPMFFKVTSQQKPIWYEPQIDPMTGQVLNPLTDLLTGDYYVTVDVTSALRPNKERQKKETIDYLTWLTSPNVMQVLMANGLMINPEEIKKASKEFGFNPESLFIQLQPQPQVEAQMGGGVPPEVGVQTQGVPS